jgi:hypothetical protein
VTTYTFRRDGYRPRGLTADQVARGLLAIHKKHGRIDTDTIVAASKPKRAPLHNAFEWDDAVAADEHRKWQARQIARSVDVTDEDTGEREPLVVHIHNEDPHYQITTVAVETEEEWVVVLQSARKAVATARDRLERLNRITARQYGRAEELVGEALDLVETA